MKKIKMLLEAIVVITVVLALVLPTSAVVTNNETEKTALTMEFKEIEEAISIGGPIKVKAHRSPVISGNGNPGETFRGTDVQVTVWEEYDGKPAIAIGDDGTLVVNHERQEDILEKHIYVAMSEDGGQTWEDMSKFNVDPGIYELPSLDYAGLVDDKHSYYGALLGDANNYGDGYWIQYPDIYDPETWGLWSVPWSQSGFFEFSSCDITTYDQIIGESTDYFVLSLVGSYEDIPPFPDCYQVPCYQISVDDMAWIFWFYYNYSSNGRMDIDRSAEIIYYAFEWDNGADQDVILLSSELQYVGVVEDEGGWGDGMGEGRKYSVEGTANAIHPAIAAENNYVYLILETDQTADQDIVCYYSSDGGDSYDMSTIADTAADETNPAVYASGQDAFCIFTKNNDLYVAETHDGGETWEIDENPINDESGSVVEEYKCADIFGGSIVWEDDRNDEEDIYYDLFNDPPGAPTITGKLKGNAGKSYEYTFNAVDPDGDDVKFVIEWGDTNSDTTGFTPSGTDIKASHTWASDGDYTITAKAVDVNGLVGPEGSLQISMPRTRAVNSLFLWFIQQFPVLRYILTL